MDQKSGKQIKASSRTTTKTSKSTPKRSTSRATRATTKTARSSTSSVRKTITESLATRSANAASKSVSKTSPKTARTSSSARSTSSAKKRPCRKIWTVLGTLFCLILLALGGLALWYFAYYNQPEKVAFDAVEHLIRSDNVSTDGVITVTPKSSPYFQSAMLFLDSSSDHLPNTMQADLLVQLDDQKEDGAFKISLGTVMMVDGVLYTRFDGLEDSLKKLGLDEDFGAVIRDALAEVDGEWWRITVSEVAKSFGVDDNLTAVYNNIYSCALETLNRDQTAELSNLYQEHKFITIKNTDDSQAFGSDAEFGYSYYLAQLSHGALADFINALPETDTAENFYACYNNVMENYTGDLSVGTNETISAQDFPEIDAEDIAKYLPEDLRITLEISDFTHEIRQLHFTMQDDEVSGMLGFGYQPVQVTAPDEYRPFSELVDRVKSILFEPLTGANL